MSIQSAEKLTHDTTKQVPNEDLKGELYADEDALEYMVTIPEGDENDVILFAFLC